MKRDITLWTAEVIHEHYLRYVNDYITLEGFASAYGFSQEEAEYIIEFGRAYNIERGTNV